jgi:HSP20 family protein
MSRYNNDEFKNFINNPINHIIDKAQKIDNIFKVMDRDLLGGSICGNQPISYFMDIDLIDNITEYIIHVDLPGINKEDIEIEITDQNLSISVERINNNIENDTKYIKKERYYGKFSRQIEIPGDIDSDSIVAKYENGILNITIQKLENIKINKKIYVD